MKMVMSWVSVYDGLININKCVADYVQFVCMYVSCVDIEIV